MATGGVDTWDFFSLCEWLENETIDYSNFETAEELRNLVRTRMSSQRAPDTSYPSTETNQSVLRNILEQNNRMKSELSRIYTEILRLLTQTRDTGLCSVLREKFGNYQDQITSNMGDLNQNECPILVLGETGSGKSSLINLLVGEQILPTAFLAETKAICCLHNSSSIRFTCEYTTGTNYTEYKDTLEALASGLYEYISRRAENRGQNDNLQFINVYCPIPFLPDNTVIVDSPGVGENDSMNQRVLQYLPKAVVLIFVINSSNAGGIQPDKLGYILEEYKRMEQEGQLVPYDFGDSIIVCNKWDVVEESQQEEEVWTDTLNKLKSMMPGLKENHIFKMSTKQALRNRELNLGISDQYQRLLRGFDRILPATARAKLHRHYRWQGRFLETIRVYISSRIRFASATKEEKMKLEFDVASELRELDRKSKEIKVELEEISRERCNLVLENLHSYLMKPKVRNFFYDWRNEEPPSDLHGGNDNEAIGLEMSKIVRSKLHKILTQWEAQEHLLKTVSTELSNIFKEKWSSIDAQCSAIDATFERVQQSDFSEELLAVSENTVGRVLSENELGTAGKIALAVTAPIWIPVSIAVGIIAIPFVLAWRGVHEIELRLNYATNDFQHRLYHYSQHVAENAFQKKNLHTFVKNTYFATFNQQIKDSFDINIKKEIKAKRLQLNLIARDICTTRNDVENMRRFLNELEQVLGVVKLFALVYWSDDSYKAEQVVRIDRIGGGVFSDVYTGIIRDETNDDTPVAVKVLKDRIRDENALSMIQEIEILRCLKHEHIIKYIGFSCCHNEPRDRSIPGTQLLHDGFTLSLLFEKCEMNLKTKIFDNVNLQCWRFSTKQEREDAFKLYINSACSICDGLKYIHSKRLIHRDLKLANVLVKDGVVKVCDLGTAKHEVLTTGTFVGTITHMSPEILRSSQYNTSTDIYSFGILLWEMWYGRFAYSEDEYAQMSVGEIMRMIEKGSRPSLDHKAQMPVALRDLAKRCWSGDPKLRPTAANAKREIQRIALTYLGHHFAEKRL